MQPAVIGMLGTCIMVFGQLVHEAVWPPEIRLWRYAQMAAGIWGSSSCGFGVFKRILLVVLPPLYAMIFTVLYYLTIIDEESEDANIVNPTIMAAYLGQGIWKIISQWSTATNLHAMEASNPATPSPRSSAKSLLSGTNSSLDQSFLGGFK